jgi:hypothetical protein
MRGIIEMNYTTTAILQAAADRNKGNKDYRAVMIKVPNDVYAKIMKDQATLLSKASDSGDTAKVTMHTVILKALRDLEV